MASAEATLEASEMECPVCHEDFAQPKILPCAHLICRHCLVTWVKTQAQVQCPLCRCAIVAPGEPGSASGEEVAEGLPTDLAMAALVDSARTLKEKRTCQACVSLPAVSICLHCGDFFCKACGAGHLRMSATRNHVIEDLSTLTAERLATSRPTLCSAHSDEACKLYCHTHGASICQLCVATKHHPCAEITDLEEKVKEARAVLSELAAMLRSGESELERAVSELDEHLTETEKATQKALADIDAACDRLKNALDACQQRLKELALTAKVDIAAIVKDAKIILLDRRGKLTSHKRLVERTERTSPLANLIDMSVTLKTRVTELDRTPVLPYKAKVITKPTLTKYPQALARIEKELSELGKIDVVGAAVCVQPQPLVLRFHTNHGQNIKLSNAGQTAERHGDTWYGMVVSCEPMVVNRLYEVKIEGIDMLTAGYTSLGVVTEDPASRSYTDVVYSGHLTAAHVIWGTAVKSLGRQTSSSVGAALATVGVGGRVGVVLDGARCLHMYVNGKDQGVAARDVTQPCFALWDLLAYWKKVTALPVSDVSV